MRCRIEAIALILWPILMSAARGYHDAGTVFGDMVVAAFGIFLTECAIHWLMEGKEG